MATSQGWSDALLKLVSKTLNNFDYNHPSAEHQLLYIKGNKVGVVPPDVVAELKSMTDCPLRFTSTGDKQGIYLDAELSTVEERSQAFEQVLQYLKQTDKFVTLQGWRNETYPVYFRCAEAPLCHVERSGCPLFGFIQYGVHISGYTFKNGELMLWIGRRSKTKETFPNMLDNMCAGGLSSGLSVRECAIKECQEEGSVDDETLKDLIPVGTLSYCYTDERGILPETEYVFDLQLPSDFVPKNADGEMQNFHLYTVDEVKNLIIAEEFKPNCALVIVDFLVRHGYIEPDDEPNYSYLLERMHMPLQPAF